MKALGGITMDKMIYLILCIVGGFLAASVGVPAGWLIGSIIVGILWGVFRGGLSFDGKLFKIALAFVAANIGLRLDPHIILEIRHLLLPLFFIILLTLTLGYLLSMFLFKKSDLDQTTSFFCCIPGGASEIIGISKEYGADERIVAAFHTVRITFFVLTIPLIVGSFNSTVDLQGNLQTAQFAWMHLLFFPLVIVLTLLLDSKLHIPGGTLLFSIAISFFLSSFVMEVPSSPAYLSGIGQALIGGLVGVRFDKFVLVQLLKVGKITMIIITFFFVSSLLMGVFFHWMTKLPFAISLLGTVPAGAAEMSATSIALDLNPSIVASLHIIRVIILFLALPFLIKIFKSIHKKELMVKDSADRLN